MTPQTVRLDLPRWVENKETPCHNSRQLRHDAGVETPPIIQWSRFSRFLLCFMNIQHKYAILLLKQMHIFTSKLAYLFNLIY